MPGFYISNLGENINNKINNVYNNQCIYEAIDGVDNYIVKRNTLNKILDDKLFVETEKYIIIIE